MPLPAMTAMPALEIMALPATTPMPALLAMPAMQAMMAVMQLSYMIVESLCKLQRIFVKVKVARQIAADLLIRILSGRCCKLCGSRERNSARDVNNYGGGDIPYILPMSALIWPVCKSHCTTLS